VHSTSIPAPIAPGEDSPENIDDKSPLLESSGVEKSHKRRPRGCGKCDNCLQEDCRECANCLDMKKYGGPDKKRQKCMMKKECLLREEKHAKTTTASVKELKTPAKAVKTPAKTKSSSKKKRAKRGGEYSALPSSRRRSDRINVIRQKVESLLGITPEAVAQKSKFERDILELRIDKFVKVLSSDTSTMASYWAIAGARLFKPAGSMPRMTVKRLGRNAGSVRAPSISYDTSYEVGETTICHYWRKRTSDCDTYEDLLYSLRFLDAHLDKPITVSAQGVTNRKANINKSPIPTAVRCVHADPATGFNEYFVVSQGNKRGCWYSEESIDLTSLIQYRFSQKRLLEEKKEQEKRDQKKKELEKIQLERKMKLMQKAAGVKRKCAPSASMKPKAHPAKKTKLAAGVSGGAKQKDVKQKEIGFEAAVTKHRDETLLLLKVSAAKGESSVPMSKMASTRLRNVGLMRKANLQVCKLGGKKLTEGEITCQMSKAEGEAVQMYVKEMQKVKRPKSVSNASTKDSPKKPAAKVSGASTACSSQTPKQKSAPTTTEGSNTSTPKHSVSSVFPASSSAQQSSTQHNRSINGNVSDKPSTAQPLKSRNQLPVDAGAGRGFPFKEGVPSTFASNQAPKPISQPPQSHTSLKSLYGHASKSNNAQPVTSLNNTPTSNPSSLSAMTTHNSWQYTTTQQPK